MSKTKFVIDYVLLPEHMEQNSGESMTVPDDSWTISEIEKRFTQGIDVNAIIRSVRYGTDFNEGLDPDLDDADLEKLHNSDPVDKRDLLLSNSETINKNKAIVDQHDAMEKTRLENEAQELADYKAELKRSKAERELKAKKDPDGGTK